MPKRPRSHQLEDLSRNRLHEAFTSRGWTVEDLTKDYGEDLLIRIFSDGAATPLAFFVQAKATDNIAKYLNKQGTHLLFPVTSDHLIYWEQFWEPVILTLWDSKSGITYWECVQTFCENFKLKVGPTYPAKTFRIHIPTDNVLDEEGLTRIQVRTRSRFERFSRERDGAEVLIRILADEFGLKLEYEPQYGVLFYPKGRFVADPGDKQGVFFFGRAAARLNQLAQRLGVTPEQILHGSLHALKQIAEAFSDGGQLIVQDQQGNIVESWHTLEAFQLYVDRREELKD